MNEEIDRLRHAATLSLLTRRDVIVVASVSAHLRPRLAQEYRDQMLWLKRGESYDRDGVLRKLVDIQYDRNDLSFVRGKFRVGATPSRSSRRTRSGPCASSSSATRSSGSWSWTRSPARSSASGTSCTCSRPPTSWPGRTGCDRAIADIEAELAERLAVLERDGKLLEAQRLRMRTNYDLEMLREVGTCNGIENYSRPIDGRDPGTPPFTLIDYFPDDFLLFLDESHVTVPQLRASTRATTPAR